MKVAIVLAASLAVVGCSHLSDDLSALSPSQLSVAEIKAEIAGISAEATALRSGADRVRRVPVPAMADPTPVRVTYVDSNGGVITNYLPGDDRGRYSRSGVGSSRPFGYARLEALAKRRAELYVELSQRELSQQ